MIGNKIALILIFIFSMTLCSFGQKIKYKDYKNDISIKKYRETIKTQKYSPIVAGVCNYVFPSSGYFYVGEPVRGTCVLGSELVTGSMFFYGFIMSMGVNSETGKSTNGARTLMFSGLIATGIIHIWSIFDVVKIAKVKNLAYQKNNLTMDIKPDLLFVNQFNTNSIAYGLRMRINF